MLLDIHEPGQTPLPHEGAKKIAVGIDLGTTHCVVAAVIDEKTEILRNAHGNALIPSAVHYPDGKTIVGEEARAAAAGGSPDAVTSIKRLMGRSAADLRKVAGGERYHVVPGDGLVKLSFADKERTPVEISADILRHLKTHAETAIGSDIADAVITVPAYFDEAARLATRDAARIAGWNVLRLLNEPTAAALAYGLDHRSEGRFAVYDLGGGTFDISILHLEKGVFQVLATGGDTQLGGDDFDHALSEWVLRKQGMPSPSETMMLLAKLREGRERLSTQDEQTIRYIVNQNEHSLSLTKAVLEQAIAPIIARTMEACRQALEDAGVTKEEISAVILVGGTTRTPLVRREVEAFFGKPPLTDVNPDEVVAAGAAIQAAALTHGADHLLLDVIPLSLGLETMGGLVEKIIHRNTPIPVSASHEFTTYKDGQDGMVIHILQGEREMVDQNRSLARFELTGIPALPAGIARVKIDFAVDADGLLSVDAQEVTTGARQQVEIKPSYGLELAEIERMLRESVENARADITRRLLAESRVEAERTAIETESAIAQDRELLRPGEGEVIAAQLRRLRTALAGTDRDEIDYEMGELAKVTRDFAERRMNTAIARAVGGKHINRWTE